MRGKLACPVLRGLRRGNAPELPDPHGPLVDNSTGRLSDDDYYERLDAVWSARVRADLEMLFTDLPKSAPPPPQVVRRPRRGRPRAFPLIACFLLVAIGLVVMGVPWWVFAAIAGGALLFHKKHSRHHHARHHGCLPTHGRAGWQR